MARGSIPRPLIPELSETGPRWPRLDYGCLNSPVSRESRAAGISPRKADSQPPALARIHGAGYHAT